MNSQITDKQINDYILSLNFDINENNFVMAAIKRAYKDFNRTLQKFPSDENLKKTIRNNWIEVLKNKIDELVNYSFENQEKFTLWHQSTSYHLRTANDYKPSQSQAQKWINMTLKYLFVFGEIRVPGISENYRFFHIPIDNIIMQKLEKLGIAKFNQAWSQINDYDSYYKYQREVRELFPDRIPMDIEFELFSER